MKKFLKDLHNNYEEILESLSSIHFKVNMMKQKPENTKIGIKRINSYQNMKRSLAERHKQIKRAQENLINTFLLS